MEPHDRTPDQTQASNRVQRNNKSRLEYRSSCDPCASSKVRCTKEQPHCSRCVHNGLKCIYSRSRRRGKPPSRKPLVQIPSSSLSDSQPLLSQPTNAWIYPHIGNNTNYNYACPWSRSPMFPTNDSVISNTDDLPGELEGIDPTEVVQACQAISKGGWVDGKELFTTVGSSNWVMLTDLDQMADDSEYPGLPCVTEQYSHDEYNDEFEDLNGQEESDMVNDGLAAHEIHEEPCAVVACNTLSSLFRHIPSSSGNRDVNRNDELGHQTSKDDSELRMIRSATEKMNRLLDCKCAPCLQDPSILMTVNAVLFKILSWYEVLHENLQNHPKVCNSSQYYLNPSLSGIFDSSSSRHSPNESSRSGDTISDSSYTIPLTFDSLKLLPMTETGLKAQLLLCELQALSQACKLLHQRAKAIEDPTRNGNVCHGSTSVLLQRTSDLQKNLGGICTDYTAN
ncbi:transcriptional regulator family: Fungal Specific TF [Penicillium herquei]|nr:transcriptional regulator family: Fungal Specific TF [Penicillium herquei]